MLVYRVEDAGGVGPYNNDRFEARELADTLCSAHQNSEHPGPYQDRPLRGKITIDHYFGFASRRDAAQWFAGWFDDLNDTGYRLAVYRAPKGAVIEGARQVAFVRHKAAKVKDCGIPAALNCVTVEV